MKKWKGLIKRGVFGALLSLLVVSSIFSMTTVQADEIYVPTTAVGDYSLSIRSYSDNSTSGFRSSQTLELIANGFASNAKLKYHYVSSNSSVPFDVVDAVGSSDVAIRRANPTKEHIPLEPYVPYLELTGNIFQKAAKALANAGIALVNAAIMIKNVAIVIANGIIDIQNKAITADNDRYQAEIWTTSNVFRVYGTGASSYPITIAVVDENPLSQTYNHTAEVSYGGYAAASLATDANISYGIFEGESLSIYDFMDSNGIVPEADRLSSPSNVSATGAVSNSGYIITGNSVGEGTISYSYYKGSSSTFHAGQSTTVSGNKVYVFKKPVVTPVAGGFEITNTEAGVTYSIGNRSYLCYADNETIVFDKLACEWEYDIVLSKVTSDGRIAKKRITSTTLKPYTVYLNYEEKPNVSNISNLYAYSKGDTVSEPDGPYAPGFVLSGWYDESTFVTEHDFSAKVTGDYTVYGKWEGLKSTLNLTVYANNELLKGAKIELYQNGNKVATLKEDGNKEGTYTIEDAIVNGTYDVYINGIDSKSTISPYTSRTAKDVTAEQLEDRISGDTLNMTLNVKKLSVVTYVDDVAASINKGNINMFNGRTFDETLYDEDAYVAYYKNDDSTVYDVYYNGSDSDVLKADDELKNVGGLRLTTSLYFNTITVNVICDDASWISKNIVLRKENGAYAATLTSTSYDSITQTRKYTTVLQDDESDTPTEYYIYVDGINTNVTVASTRDDREATLYFDTANVTLKLDSGAYENAEVIFSNDKHTYSITDNTNGVYTAHLYRDGEAYTYKLVNVVDTKTHTEYVTTLNYYTVNFKSYEKNSETGDPQAINYRKYIVLEGEKVASPGEAYYPGLAFNCWNETAYEVSEGSQTSFDFNSEILTAKTLYAHFKNATVEINGYVKSDASGTLSDTGTSFTMPNLTIEGYGDGKEIRSIRAEFTNIQSVKIPSQSNVELACQNGTMPEAADNYYTFTGYDSNSISITFSENVTVKEAQTFLRGIIVTPKQDSEIKVNFTASSMPVSVYKESDWTYITDTTGEVWTVITEGSTTGKTLTTGNYYIKNDVSFSCANGNGIVIDGDVKIYIPENVTLTATGADGSGQTAGKAAILLAEGNTLTVLGNGTLSVQGGNAGNGSNGEGYTDSRQNGYLGAYFDYPPNYPRAPFSGGGAGGAGGGGAGAGVGTDGTNGGAGGSRASQIGLWNADQVTSVLPNWYNVVNSSGDTYSPVHNGGNGGSTSVGANPGTLSVGKNIVFTGSGGSSGIGGSGGKRPTAAGGYGWYCTGDVGNLHVVVTCGAGGGGGGGGQKAYLYGSGGAGGAGGGGGGGGRVEASTHGYYYYKATGGAGGAGAVAGTSGSDNGFDYTAHGYGTGGASGTCGGEGSNISSDSYLLNDEPKYTVTFDATAYGGEKTVEEYSYFNATSVTVPNCFTPTGLVFKGWVVTTYGSAYETGNNPLTGDDVTKYQPGDTIDLSAVTSGNITLKPVYEAVVAKYAVGNLTIDNTVFVADPAPVTYYTYTVNTLINGTVGEAGTITLKNGSKEYALASNGNGVYTYTTTEDLDFDVYFNGTDSGLNVTKNSSTDVALSSIELDVCLDGVANDDYSNIQLVGANGVLSLNDKYINGEKQTGKYEVIGLASQIESSYDVYINNEDTGIEVTEGQTKTINYRTITVPVTGNAEPDEAILRNGGKDIEMKYDTAAHTLTAIGLEDTQTNYHLYVNSMDTNIDNLVFKADANDISLSMNECIAKVYRNGALYDSSLFIPYIGTEPMEKVSDGVYKKLVFETVNAVTVNGKEFAVIGTVADIYTFTVAYDLNGGTGTLPVDETVYYTDDCVTISTVDDITWDDAQFIGWEYNVLGVILDPGTEITCAATQPVFKATYKLNSEYDLFVSVGTGSRYLMASELEAYLAEAGEDDPVNITVQKACALPSITLKEGDSLTVKENLNYVTIQSLTNYGTVTIEDGSVVKVTGDVKNLLKEGSDQDEAGKFTVGSGAELDVGSNLINEKTFINNGTTHIYTGKLANKNDAVFENNNTLETNYFENDGYLNNSNTLKLNSEGSINNGTISNSKYIVDLSGSDNDILTNNGVINNDGGTLTLNIINEGSVIGGKVADGKKVTNGENGLTENLSGNEAAEQAEKAQEQTAAKQEIEQADEDKNIVYLALNGGTVNYTGLSYADSVVHMNEENDKIPYTPVASIDNPSATSAFVLPTTITKTGYVFDGWYAMPDYSGDKVTQVDVDVCGERAFYAKWVLEEGNKEKAADYETTVDTYTIQGTSYCEVKSNADTEVAGLDTATKDIFLDELEGMNEGTTNGNTITLPDVVVEMNVNTSADCDNEEKEAIRDVTNDTEKVTYVGITIKKYVGDDPTGTEVEETDAPIETIITFKTSDIPNVSGILRNHNGTVETMANSDSHEDGTYYLEIVGDETIVHIFSSKYSEFGITYIPQPVSFVASGYSGYYDGNTHYAAATVNVAGATIYYSVDDGESYTTIVPSIKEVGTVNVIARAMQGSEIIGTTEYKLELKAKRVEVLTTPEEVSGGITFDGNEHELITAGTLDDAGSHIEYKLNDGTYSTEIPKAKDAGTYTITYKIVTDSNHDGGEEKTITVTIDQKEITVNGITGVNRAYNGTTIAELDCSAATFTGCFNNDDQNLSVTATGTFNNKDAGTDKAVTISNYQLSGTASKNYKVDAANSQTATTASITAKDVTVTITPNGGYYGSYIKPATAKVNDLADGDYVDITMTYVGTAYDGTTMVNGTTVPTQAGTYTVTASISENNYTLTGTATSEFAVKKQIVTVPAIDWVTFDDKHHEADVSDKPGLYTVTKNDGGTNAGTYEVELTLVDNSNYRWSNIDSEVLDKDSPAATLTDFIIAQGDNYWVVTPSVKDITYGETIEPEYSAAYGKYTVSIHYEGTMGTNYSSYDKPTEAGRYCATFSVPSTNSYRVLTWNAYFSIYKKEVTLSWAAPASLVYDGEEKMARAYATNLLDGDKCRVTVEVSKGDGTDAGEVTYKAVSLSNSNYKLPKNVTSPTYTIEPKTVEASFGEITLVYSGKAQGPEVLFEGLVEGDTCEAVFEDMETLPGKYTAKVIGVSNKNYQLKESKSADYEITKADAKAPTENSFYYVCDLWGNPVIHLNTNDRYEDGSVIVYEISENKTDILEKRTLKAGQEYFIRAQGNDNYNASEWVSITAREFHWLHIILWILLILILIFTYKKIKEKYKDRNK